MHDPQNTPEKLISVPNEMEAAMIVSALAARDIDASTAGSFTAGFRAEAPGEVQVLVRHADLDRAQVILAEFNKQPTSTSPATASNSVVASGNSWKLWLLVGLLALLPLAVLYSWD